MRIYDISLPIFKGMTVYEGDPQVQVRPASQIEKGAPMNLTRLSLGSHTGTHVDAPFHFVPGGATVDRLSLGPFIGKALVRHIRCKEAITCPDLEEAHIPNGTERLLLRTSNSQLWEKGGFQRGFVYLMEDGARWLVDRGMKLVGIDYLSIDAFGSKDFPSHNALLKAGVIIVEGLDLRNVPSGEYTLVCLPLRLAGGDGAPARAVLMDDRT